MQLPLWTIQQNLPKDFMAQDSTVATIVNEIVVEFTATFVRQRLSGIYKKVQQLLGFRKLNTSA